jgi:hypothetical protein
VKPSLKLSLLGAIGALALPLSAHAQWWSQHPGYLHAMSDLRTAYWMLQHHETFDPVANEEERHAIGEIRAAYLELREASVVDGKDIDDQPPADFAWGDHRGRLHKAMELLRRAQDEIGQEEDNPAARGLRNRAMRHIDEAGRSMIAAFRAWNYDQAESPDRF